MNKNKIVLTLRSDTVIGAENLRANLHNKARSEGKSLNRYVLDILIDTMNNSSRKGIQDECTTDPPHRANTFSNFNHSNVGFSDF